MFSRDRMPIHHKINPSDRKRIVRTSSRHSTAKTRPSVSKDLEESFYITTAVVPKGSDGYFDVTLESPLGSDSEKEDKPDDAKQSECERVYLAACKQCRVAPGKGVLQGLGTQRLSVKGLQLTSRDIEPITYALTRNHHVTTLDVSSNDIGKDGLNNIIRMLDENMSLTNLNISHNNVGTTGARLLSELIANSKMLKTISASGNKFGDEDASCIAESLKVSRVLQSLNLSHNNFHERGGETLAEGIEENTSLTDLDLSWNHLRLGGAIAIAEALKENKTLETLNIAWNGFSNAGCKVISGSLEVNTKLHTLNLSNNRIGYDGAKAVMNPLYNQLALLFLQLNLNSLSTLGAFELLMAIRDNPGSAIEKLELQEVPVLASAQIIEQEIKSVRPSFILIHDVVVLSDDHLALSSVINKRKVTSS
ncbi:leucine-rich repeat-containing protein 74A-like [Ylistrum balloti]|uniref:leucine-rich repeat-containing protein 74A-like n=1 Tax=Ylistrum balloti TaxID=509963 RepID=UPI002905DA65|nr:leucine-rich repeat-containing protein 74A-like [Ylistrum balloti]